MEMRGQPTPLQVHGIPVAWNPEKWGFRDSMDQTYTLLPTMWGLQHANGKVSRRQDSEKANNSQKIILIHRK